LEKRRLRGDLTAPYSFMRRGCGEGGAELFALGSCDRMHGNGSNLHQATGSPGKWSWHSDVCQSSRSIWTMLLVMW